MSKHFRTGFRTILLWPIACCLWPVCAAQAAPGFANVTPAGTARIAAFLVQFQQASTSLTADTGVFHADTTTLGNYARVLLDRADTFYRRISYGKMQLAYTVFDTLMVTVSDTKAGYTMRTDTNGLILLVREVLARVDTYVDFSQYHSVTLFHAGPGKSITSKTGDLQTKVQNISSMPFTDTQTNETVGYAIITPLETYKLTSSLSISFFGTFCHEFGHELGLPDLYNTTSADGGNGDWTLLGNGNFQGAAAPILGDSPTWMDPWSREYLNWGDTVQIDTTTYVTMNPVESDSRIYKILAAAGDTSEYFLLEFRYPGAGDPDTAAGVGLLIWHIDQDTGTITNNDVNNTTVVKFRRLDLEEADGTDIGKLSGSYVATSSHPWPGAKGKTAFADNTTPNSRPNSDAAARFSIKYITLQNSKLTLLVDFADVKAPVDSFLTAPDQWALFSLPFPLHKITYTADSLVRDLNEFGVTFSASQLFRWNPEVSSGEEDPILQKYSALSLTSAFSAGYGYWARLTDSTSKDIQETAQTSALSDTTRYDTVPVALFSGWNQIGNPFKFKILVKDLKFVSTAGSTYTYSAAITNGLLRDGEVYYYKPETGYIHGPSLAGATVTNPALEPFKGLWLYAAQNCTMLVPPYASLAPPGAGFSAPSLATGAYDWSVRFEVVNQRGDANRQTEAGVRSRSSRAPKAPSAPTGIWVGWEEAGEHYSAVYRAPTDARSWRLKVGTDA